MRGAPVISRTLGSPIIRALVSSPGYRTGLRGHMAEVMVKLELGLRGFATAFPEEDYGVDLFGYRKGSFIAVQVKSPNVLHVKGDDVGLQYMVDMEPLVALKEDPGFWYCFVVSAPEVPDLGVHFAWLSAKELWDFLNGPFHRRTRTWPSRVTLRLRASRDGKRLYYKYFTKGRHDLSDKLDIAPTGAPARDCGGTTWDEYTRTLSHKRLGGIYVGWAMLELMARGIEPQPQALDRGVDLVALRLPGDVEGDSEIGPRYLSYQVKGISTFDYFRGGYRMGFLFAREAHERLEGLGMNFLFMVEGRTQDKKGPFARERHFLTVPWKVMKGIFAISPRIRRKGTAENRTQDYIRVDIWTDKTLKEFWALDAKKEKAVNMTGWLDAWERVV